METYMLIWLVFWQVVPLPLLPENVLLCKQLKAYLQMYNSNLLGKGQIGEITHVLLS